MARLKSLVTFATVAVAAFLGLRLLHVAVPMFFPETHPGPIVLATPEDAAEVAGFPPLVPAYRPRALGEDPPRVTFYRVPRPTVVLEWHGPSSLAVREALGGEAIPIPEEAARLPDGAGALWWREDGITWIALERDGVHVLVQTDLSEVHLARLVRSLRPA